MSAARGGKAVRDGWREQDWNRMEPLDEREARESGSDVQCELTRMKIAETFEPQDDLSAMCQRK